MAFLFLPFFHRSPTTTRRSSTSRFKVLVLEVVMLSFNLVKLIQVIVGACGEPSTILSVLTVLVDWVPTCQWLTTPLLLMADAL
jgi:hypothetical protein